MSGTKRAAISNEGQLEENGKFVKLVDDAALQRKVLKAKRKSSRSATSASANPFNDFGGFTMSSGSTISAPTSLPLGFLEKLAGSKNYQKNKTQTTSDCRKLKKRCSSSAEFSSCCTLSADITQACPQHNQMNAKKIKCGAQIEYLSNIKELNIFVADWIKSNVDENPLCFLTPVFNDYNNYLKKFEEQKQKAKEAAAMKESQSPQNEFSSKVMALNKETADRIKHHVEANPLCNLSPVFEEYLSKMKVYQNVLKMRLQYGKIEPKAAATSPEKQSDSQSY